MDEPLIIGSERCFGDAIELPAELRDRGIAEFGEDPDRMVWAFLDGETDPDDC